jgi:hypothetical protein
MADLTQRRFRRTEEKKAIAVIITSIGVCDLSEYLYPRERERRTKLHNEEVHNLHIPLEIALGLSAQGRLYWMVM